MSRTMWLQERSFRRLPLAEGNRDLEPSRYLDAMSAYFLHRPVQRVVQHLRASAQRAGVELLQGRRYSGNGRRQAGISIRLS